MEVPTKITRDEKELYEKIRNKKSLSLALISLRRLLNKNIAAVVTDFSNAVASLFI